jgi:hypothetical protein
LDGPLLARLRRQQRAAGGVIGGGASNGGLLRREQRLRLGNEGPDAGGASHRDGTGQLCGNRRWREVGARAWGSVMDPNGLYSHVDMYYNIFIYLFVYLFIYLFIYSLFIYLLFIYYLLFIFLFTLP